jgi:cytochrome c553
MKMPGALRWVLYVLGGLIGLVLIALGLIYGLSEFRLRQTYDFPVVAAQAATDEFAIARGEHLARAILICTECHGHDFAGKPLIEDPVIANI